MKPRPNQSMKLTAGKLVDLLSMTSTPKFVPMRHSPVVAYFYLVRPMRLAGFATLTLAFAVSVLGADRGVQSWVDGQGPPTYGITANGKKIVSVSGKRTPWAHDCLRAVGPEYPARERAARHQGTGTFRLVIDPATGFVTSVGVVKSTGYAALDGLAIKSFRQWRWKPHTWREINLPVVFIVTRQLLPIPRGATRLPVRTTNHQLPLHKSV